MTWEMREAASRRLMTELSTTTLSVGMALMERRSRAVAEYWRSFAAVREPSELLAVQLGYCHQMMDDYAAAMSESLSSLKQGATPAPEAPSAPADEARAA
jgi:hypothetical protein